MKRRTVIFTRHGGTILTVCSIVGFAGTVIFTANGTIKAVELLKEAEDAKKSPLSNSEKALIVIPSYIPAIVTGSLTIVCILSMNVLSKKSQESLLSAYAMATNYHKRYRDKLIELKGEEVDAEVRAVLAREYADYHAIGMDYPDVKMTFYDEASGETFVRYEREVMDAEYHLNRNFALGGCVSLNDFYMFLGLPETDYGNEVGWTAADGYVWIDFEHRLLTQDDGGEDIYEIVPVFAPHEEYLEG